MRAAVPLAVTDDAVRLAIVNKLVWIRRQQAKFRDQPRQSAREMASGESHYYLGRRYQLRVIESAELPHVTLRGKATMLMRVRAGTSAERRERILAEWYRTQLREFASPLFERWSLVMNVAPSTWGIRRMKTKWGSCNTDTGSIWLNLELAKKSPQCIEYLIVHELAHLIERNHNDRFQSLMGAHLPDWRARRRALNSAPLAFTQSRHHTPQTWSQVECH